VLFVRTRDIPSDGRTRLPPVKDVRARQPTSNITGQRPVSRIIAGTPQEILN